MRCEVGWQDAERPDNLTLSVPNGTRDFSNKDTAEQVSSSLGAASVYFCNVGEGLLFLASRLRSEECK